MRRRVLPRSHICMAETPNGGRSTVDEPSFDRRHGGDGARTPVYTAGLGVPSPGNEAISNANDSFVLLS